MTSCFICVSRGSILGPFLYAGDIGVVDAGVDVVQIFGGDLVVCQEELTGKSHEIAQLVIAGVHGIPPLR